GQFAVGALITRGLRWDVFWASMGVAGLLVGGVLFALLPKDPPSDRAGGWLKTTGSAFATVFRNPQSILCGLIAGLLFIPTTIFDMIWGVRFMRKRTAWSTARPSCDRPPCRSGGSSAVRCSA